MHFFNHDAYIELAEKIKTSGSPDTVEDLEALNDVMTSHPKIRTQILHQYHWKK